MGFKWIGAIIVLLSCSGCGFAVAAVKRREERLLLQLMEVLQFLESELQYHLTPLPDLCRMAAGQTKGLLQVVFLNLYRELNWQTLPDAKSCMYAAIRRSGDVPIKVRRILIQLGGTLGRFDLSGQLEGLRCARKRCSDTLSEIWKNQSERIRSYQTLGICAGAALAIILI